MRGQTYVIETAPGAEIWVNGERVERKVLASGDLIEVGEGGPVLRFRLYEPGTQPYKSMGEAFSDCRDCARHGGKGLLQRLRIVLGGTPVELATQTSPRFRINLVIALVLVVAMMGALTWRNMRLEGHLAEERRRVEGLADLVEGGESGTFSTEDFNAARLGIEDRLSDAMARVEALESRLESRQRVISTAMRSVVFLQASFGFVEAQSGRPLRYASETGKPRRRHALHPRWRRRGGGGLLHRHRLRGHGGRPAADQPSRRPALGVRRHRPAGDRAGIHAGNAPLPRLPA